MLTGLIRILLGALAIFLVKYMKKFQAFAEKKAEEQKKRKQK